MSVEDYNAGPAQKQSSGSMADPSEERANPATDSREMSSENDPSQAYSSRSAQPERSGDNNERKRLQRILWQQYIQDDETNDDFRELISTTNKLIRGGSRTDTLGSALSQATQFGLERSMQVMINEVERADNDYLHGIVNWHAKSLENWTPLHVACVLGRSDIVKLLVDHEADILARDDEDQTPLILATRRQEISCMKALLITQREQRYTPVNDGKSAFQWAIEDGFTQGVVEMFEDPSDYPNDEDVRNAAGQVLTYAVCTEDDLYDQVEKIVDYLGKEKLPLPKHPKDPDNSDAFLSWAVERHGRHSIAKQLLQRESRGPTALAAIEEAARQRKPKVLWSLIAASPRDSGTINQIRAALTNFKGKDGKLDEARNTTTSTDVKIRNANKVSPTVQVIHILRNPPVGLLFGAHGKIDLKAPKPKEGDMEILKQFDSAIVAEFYGGRDVPVQSVQNVYDVVYSGKGLDALLKDAKKFSMFTKRDKAPDAAFTWIHLPATNIKWMEDLSLKLMVEPGCCTEEIQDVISFLRTSWFQVPDQYSKTRIMRPQFKQRLNLSGSKETRSRDMNTENTTQTLHTPESSVAVDTKAEEKRKEEEESRDVEGKKPSSFVPSSAVYMPFLSFSTLSGLVNSEDWKLHKTWPILDETAEQRIQNTGNRYRNLIDKFDKSQTVHGCATLDEAYYHFSSENVDSDAKKDCTARNRSQVVTKQFLRGRSKTFPEGDAPKAMMTYWPVLRVNQIWIWTIANKWLISATSHQHDDYEQSWSDGFIHHLNRRLATGGTQPQPASTTDMMRVMIDYCIGFYERRRECDDLEHKTDAQKDDLARKLSMRQIFSNHINYVGRTETNLFEEFRQNVGGNRDITTRVEMAKEAISKAESLLSEIKDVRDELNILSSIVNYQNTVQRQVHDKPSSESGLSSRYISNDIVNMEKLATRIQSAVDSTLSLSGSHIANLQAEEAARQGKSLMMFTISTIIFLPLSFLTSLFALNIESFQSVPGWVFGIIFGVSSTVTVLVIILAHWNSTWTSVKTFLDDFFARHGHARDDGALIKRAKFGNLTLQRDTSKEPEHSNAQISKDVETVTAHNTTEGQSRTTLRRLKKLADPEKGPA